MLKICILDEKFLFGVIYIFGWLILGRWKVLFHDSSTLIGVQYIKRKMGLPEWPQDKTIAEEPVDIQ